MAKTEALLEAKQVTRGGGDTIAVGKCPRCNKNCTLSSANKTGVTCRTCQLQFNAKGVVVGTTIGRTDVPGDPNPTLSFELNELRDILYTETSILSQHDVPLLLAALLEAKKLYVPGWVKRAVADGLFCSEGSEVDPEEDEGSQVFCDDNNCDLPECHRCFPRAKCVRHEKCVALGQGKVTS